MQPNLSHSKSGVSFRKLRLYKQISLEFATKVDSVSRLPRKFSDKKKN